ncbi:MAG: 2-hydroxyacyl-CoA dehydratase family protein [Dehalococcoidia bacterium]
MAYKTKKLESWQWAKEIRYRHYQKLQGARENGIPIFTGSGHAPWSIISGIGDFAALCGEPWSASVGYFPELAQECSEAMEAKGWGRDVCGYLKQYVGSMLIDKGPWGPFPRPDYIFQSVDCDLESSWYNMVAQHLDIPLFYTEILHDGHPRTPKDATVQYLADHYARAVEWLQEVTGKEYNDQALLDAMTLTWESRKLWSEICEMQKAVPAPLDMKSMYTLYLPAEIEPHNPEVVDFYKSLRDEVRHRVDKNIAAVGNERCRVLHDDIPPWHALHLFRLMEEYGVVVSASAYVFGLSGVWEEGEDGVYRAQVTPPKINYPPRTREEALWLQAWMDISVVRPMTNVQSAISVWRSLIRDWNCQGAIFHINRGCILTSYGVMQGRKALKDDGVTTMIYESSHVDKREWNETEVRDRIEAFMESLGLKPL